MRVSIRSRFVVPLLFLAVVGIAATTAAAEPSGDGDANNGTPHVGRSRYDPPGHGIIYPPPYPRPPYPPPLPPHPRPPYPLPPYIPYPPYYPPAPRPPYIPYDYGSPAMTINAEGVNAYGRGDYYEAMRLYHIAKDMGYPAAFTNIGVCYQNGLGVPQSYYEAARWFYEASLRGHAVGRQYLDALVASGLVPPPPYPTVAPYYPPPVPTPSPVYARPEGLGAAPNAASGEGAGKLGAPVRGE